VGKPGWPKAHLELYLRTDGAQGQFLDFTPAGGPADMPCLILKTIGRRTGQAHLLPLIYGEDAGRYVIVASKGGAPADPAWFLNLQANPEVAIQVGRAKYAATARAVDDEAERTRLFTMMADLYPPYLDYQARTDRKIPLVTLEQLRDIDSL
jgi:deazaflavin-dependent oxidoreductase (nitroreductase family)